MAASKKDYRPTTREGVRGHIVHRDAYDTFVPAKYGKDGHTKKR